MKKIIIACLFMLLMIPVSSQDEYVTLRANFFCYKHEISIDQWSKFSHWQSCNILINMDIDNNKITIYSDETQVYHVASESTDYHNDEIEADVIEFFAVSRDNNKCLIRFVTFDDGEKHLYIIFSDIIFVYEVKIVN